MSSSKDLKIENGLITNLHSLRRWYRLFHPMVASVVIVRDENNKRYNLMPAVWVYPISAREPYLAVGVAPERYTYELLMREEGFAVSILPASKYSIVRKLGNLTGREVDKVKELGLELEDGVVLPVPHLKDSLAWLEVRKEEVIARDNWDHALFIGKVIASFVRADSFDLENLIWKVEGGNVPVTWLGGPYFALASERLKAEG